VLGDHGGGQAELKLAADTLVADWRAKGVHVYYLTNTGAAQKVSAYLSEKKVAPGGHAGVAESAQVMFLDFKVQGMLYRWAKEHDVGDEELDWIFQYPHGRGSNAGLIHHEPNHANHLHVRFRCARGDSSCE